MRPKSWLAALLVPAVIVVACGGKKAPPPAAPAPVASAPVADAALPEPVAAQPDATAPGAPPEKETIIRFVRVDHDWMRHHMRAEIADVRAWAKDPSNAKKITPPFRHVLVRINERDPAQTEAKAKKKAEAALARIKRGEDFAKVAKELSDDPGSKDKGGMYAGDQVALFVDPVRQAYEGLAPGAVHKDLVKTQFGFHVVRKDKVDDDSMTAAYRKANGEGAAKKFADAVLARVEKGASFATASADTAREQLGDRDLAATGRPTAMRIVLAELRPAPSRDCEDIVRAGAASFGKAIVVTSASGNATFVVRAGKEVPDAGKTTERGSDDPVDACAPGVTPNPGGGQPLTPEQLRRLIEELQRRGGG